MTTPILGIDEGADGQTSLYAVYNAGLRALEAATNDTLEVDLTGSDDEVTSAEFRSYFCFKITDSDSGQTLTVPDATKRFFSVWNDTVVGIDVACGTTIIVVPAGVCYAFMCDGNANGMIRVQ